MKNLVEVFYVYAEKQLIIHVKHRKLL